MQIAKCILLSDIGKKNQETVYKRLITALNYNHNVLFFENLLLEAFFFC